MILESCRSSMSIASGVRCEIVGINQANCSNLIVYETRIDGQNEMRLLNDFILYVNIYYGLTTYLPHT